MAHVFPIALVQIFLRRVEMQVHIWSYIALKRKFHRAVLCFLFKAQEVSAVFFALYITSICKLGMWIFYNVVYYFEYFCLPFHVSEKITSYKNDESDYKVLDKNIVVLCCAPIHASCMVKEIWTSKNAQNIWCFYTKSPGLLKMGKSLRKFIIYYCSIILFWL